jgi:hypothetical protein
VPIIGATRARYRGVRCPLQGGQVPDIGGGHTSSLLTALDCSSMFCCPFCMEARALAIEA